MHGEIEGRGMRGRCQPTMHAHMNACVLEHVVHAGYDLPPLRSESSLQALSKDPMEHYRLVFEAFDIRSEFY